MYKKKDYNIIEIGLTYDELKLISDSLSTKRRKENPKSCKSIELLELGEKIKGILKSNSF